MSDQTIISLDPASPIRPIPLIADILRTRNCIPGSVFLVEAIDRRVQAPRLVGSESASGSGSGDGGVKRPGKRRSGSRSGRRERAVRLLLGDGELVVQALVRPEIHCFVDGGSVYEGCYVRVDKFELGWVGGADGVGKVVYLVVGDMVTVGWNEEYLGMLRRERGAEAGMEVAENEVAGIATTAGLREIGVGGGVEVMLQPLADEMSEEAAVAVSEEAKSWPDEDLQPSTRQDRPDMKAAENQDVSGPDDTLETLEIYAEKAEPPPVTTIAQNPARQKQTNNQSNKPRPWMSNDPTQPVKLTLLRAIPALPYKQNWMVNILAVVVSLSDVEPSHLEPYLQRTARLADPSTLKHVHLTVVLDPQGFTPMVGSVVLLRGVKNHMYDGGSLRKYVSDRPRNGTSWWVQHPETLGWCDEEAARLRAWWEGSGGRRVTA
ncbi:hypothetical protein BT67DRAFT_435090 [Trichocladium antarcticum]|uniref:Uncharacterized protein n=1 Tax=Trichocladium antarcticum TaxID=1450529 RepID=A0AAN6UK70_9PEZI|nr:hypothetical protein BT67DRAFT_435090 [Trichocladium antarcticum]